MKIIDCHLHVSEIEEDTKEMAKTVGNLPTLEGIKKEMARNGVVGGVVISGFEKPAECLETLKMIAQENSNIKCVLGIDPGLMNKVLCAKLEKYIAEGFISGIKIYPSYLPYYPNDKIYSKFYQMAIKHNIPAIVHTGAVLSNDNAGRVRQKYAHPLHVDDLAVDFPKLRIVMAHSGYPWIVDAAQVAYKNENVFLDFSGLKEETVRSNTVLDQQIVWAFHYVEDHEKFMYGSDWPIIKMHEYIAWIRKLVPAEMQSKFFYENAKKFFGFNI
jgi:hypothetical protein